MRIETVLQADQREHEASSTEDIVMTHKEDEFPNPASPALLSPHAWVIFATETASRADRNADAPKPSTKQAPKPARRETSGLFSRLLNRFQST